MRSFTIMTVSEKEYAGSGYYDRDSDGMQIEAIDSVILNVFKKAIRDNVKLSGIGFAGGESDAVFRGPYMVKRVSGNSVQLIKL